MLDSQGSPGIEALRDAPLIAEVAVDHQTLFERVLSGEEITMALRDDAQIVQAAGDTPRIAAFAIDRQARGEATRDGCREVIATWLIALATRIAPSVPLSA